MYRMFIMCSSVVPFPSYCASRAAMNMTGRGCVQCDLWSSGHVPRSGTAGSVVALLLTFRAPSTLVFIVAVPAFFPASKWIRARLSPHTFVGGCFAVLAILVWGGMEPQSCFNFPFSDGWGWWVLLDAFLSCFSCFRGKFPVQITCPSVKIWSCVSLLSVFVFCVFKGVHTL